MNKQMNILMALALLTGLFQSSIVFAHCDTVDGPVVMDAKKALEKRDVTPVLKWIRPLDENAVRDAFKKAQAKPGENNKFFALVVKLHRKSEGAPFEGLKPAGTPSEPGVREADQATESGSGDALISFVQNKVADKIAHRLHRVVEAKKHKDESVEAGRHYVRTYVEFVHYVEGLVAPDSGSHDKDLHKH